MSDPDDPLAKVKEALAAGRKIEAIKLYRAHTGLGLKEAKDAVEEMEAELGPASPGGAAKPRAKGCMSVLAVVVVAMGIGFLASCVSPKPPPTPPERPQPQPAKPVKKSSPSLLPSREAAAWRENASRIQSGQITVYYYGTAQEETGSTPERWAGTVTGDIYVITPNARTVIPKGTLRVAPNGKIHVSGANETVLNGR
jgi:hypothetical protein